MLNEKQKMMKNAIGNHVVVHCTDSTDYEGDVIGGIPSWDNENGEVSILCMREDGNNMEFSESDIDSIEVKGKCVNLDSKYPKLFGEQED